MEPWEVGVREKVRDLVARYTWAADGGHTKEVAECFTVDGVLDVGEHGGRWEGRAEIARQLDAVVARVAASGTTPGPVRHHVTNLLVLDPTLSSALARSYFAVYTSVGLDHWGRYYDRVHEQEGRWRFAERVVRVDGRSADSIMVTPPAH